LQQQIAHAGLRQQLTSIPTPTHIEPVAPRFVRAAVPDPHRFAYKRTLWLPEEIDAALSGKAGIPELVEPRFHALLQRYIGGYYVSGALNGDPKKLHPDFERLVNVPEVWVMCFRSPKSNQWRLMGRFTAHNEFLGLGLYQRSYLDGDHKYQSVVKAFLAHWQKNHPGSARLDWRCHSRLHQPTSE